MWLTLHPAWRHTCLSIVSCNEHIAMCAPLVDFRHHGIGGLCKNSASKRCAHSAWESFLTVQSGLVYFKYEPSDIEIEYHTRAESWFSWLVVATTFNGSSEEVKRSFLFISLSSTSPKRDPTPACASDTSYHHGFHCDCCDCIDIRSHEPFTSESSQAICTVQGIWLDLNSLFFMGQTSYMHVTSTPYIL